jgi:hypothetical protein
MLFKKSLQSRRKHKAWGVSRRTQIKRNCEPMKWASAGGQKCLPFFDDRAVTRIRGLEISVVFYLGLTPQALCLRLLRRPKVILCKAKPLCKPA